MSKSATVNVQIMYFKKNYSKSYF